MITISKGAIQTVLDPITGELIGQNFITPLGHKPSVYGKNNWCRRNQKIGDDMMKKFNELYTAKGKVFNHLINSMGYGNFAYYSPTAIGEILGMTRQAVYKAKKELIEDGFIKEGINRRTLEKGVIINEELYSKGEPDEDIMTLEDYAIWKKEQEEKQAKESEKE